MAMLYPKFRMQRGLTLIELMVSIALGLLILLGLTTIFANNSRARTEAERGSRQLENGRYAMQIITADLRLAGFFDGYYPTTAPAAASIPPTAANVCAFDTTTLANGMSYHVQGYNDSTAAGLTCISDVKSGTNILVVRHASSCSSANPADTDCDSTTVAGTFIQAGGCSTDPSTFKLDTVVANLDLQKVNCTSPAAIRRYKTNIYFIANNNNTSPNDGVPTLKRAELGAGTFTTVPLVEGIENLQLEYGIADSSTNTIPVTYKKAGNVADGLEWWNVMAVRVSLLSKSEAIASGYTDTKTYQLGSTLVAAANDGYRRNAYTGIVSLTNPAGRR
jgi:type IV pilus assembly protein PilW